MAKNKSALLHILLMSLLVIPAQQSVATFNSTTTVISVSSSQGNDGKCQNGGTPCKSLQRANALLKMFVRDVTVVILENTTLHTVFEVINSSDIRIVGNSSFADIVRVNCSGDNAGFVVDHVRNFSFSNISVVNCTANYTGISSHDQRFAFLVHSSGNVLIAAARFENCSNNTAVVFLDNHHNVTVKGTTFTENYIRQKRNKYHTQKSNPGALSIVQNSRDSNGSVHYSISSSLFRYNLAPVMADGISYTNDSSEFRYRGYGGAIFIEFGGNTSGSCVTIRDTDFTFNVGARGGGLYAYYTDSARGNRIQVSNCLFLRNSADISGGGVNVGYYGSTSLQNDYLLEDNSFGGNSAQYGGGLTIFSVYGDKKLTHLRSLVFVNNTFRNNRAVLSAAVDVQPLLNEHEPIGGYLPVPVFANCSFVFNSVVDNSSSRRTRHINSGVFSIKRFKVLFGGYTTFTNNKYSALLIMFGVAEFESRSKVVFSSNIGHNGGAILMYSFSTVLLNPNSSLNFTKNMAIENGGAIYYSTSDQHNFLSSSRDCFIRNSAVSNFSLVNTTQVVFEGNMASGNGLSVYSESFDSCYQRCRSIVGAKNVKRSAEGSIFKCSGNFTLDKATDENWPLTSSAKRFNFYAKHRGPYHVYPEYSFKLPFHAVDDFQHKVKPLMRVSRTDFGSNSSLFHNVSVRDPYTLSNTIFPRGVTNSTAKFELTILGKRQISFGFKVTLKPCPPGYYNWMNKCKCATAKHGYPAITKCADFTFSAVYRSSMWAGYIPENSSKHTNLYFAPCAHPICNDSNHQLPTHRDDLVKLICADHRTGVMCGRCVQNYSTHFHSRTFACGSTNFCYLGLLFYFLSEIVPVVIICVVTVVFDLSFTSGAMVSFVFFNQYLNQLAVDMGIVFSYLRMPYRIFYGLFNFDFFNIEQLSFCLWKKAQILDIIAVKYMTIATAFGLILVVIAMVHNNLCSKVLPTRSSAQSSVVHGLSAFLVICYAQCTKTSFYILKYTKPVGFKGAQLGYYTYYGGLPYFGKQHLMYAVPALFSLLFVTILPPLVLLLYPLSLHLLSLCGLSEHWLVNMTLRLTGINKLKPFIDCFQSCYKDRLRFFAGLFFVYRVAIVLLYGMVPDSIEFSMYSGVLLLLIIGIHSSIRPFKEENHNTVDSLIMFNLAFINGFTLISKYLINQLSDPYGNPYILLVNSIQLVHLYLPMIGFLVYIGKAVFCYLKSRRMRGRARGIEVDNILIEHADVDRTSSGLSGSLPRISYGTIQDTY